MPFFFHCWVLNGSAGTQNKIDELTGKTGDHQYICGNLKQVVAILLLAGLLSQMFSKALIVAEFELNRDYIAKNLCVNRNKPKMHCNGRCHLMKKMKQEDSKDQENPERRLENRLEIICAALTPLRLNHTLIVSTIQYPVFKENTCTVFVAGPFHPPQA
jgi:hypothetical protein